MAVRRGPNHAQVFTTLLAPFAQSILGIGQSFDNILLQFQNSLLQSTTSFAIPGITGATGAGAYGTQYYYKLLDLLSGLF
jgi:hypothetical protein